MLILVVDTSGQTAGVAIEKDGLLLYTQSLFGQKGHSKNIMGMVEAGCRALEIRPEDFDLLAAVVGPGSFTGVRIGVSTVKGMAFALKKPCVSVNALEALDAGIACFSGVVCPILDARAGQVYTAAFEGHQRFWTDEAEKMAALLPRWRALDKPLLFVGDGVAVHRAVIEKELGALAHFAPAHLCAVLTGAASSLAARDAGAATDAAALEPLYLRASQAERERLEREGHA